MANLLQSSQNQATTAPGYFTDYLTNIAQRGTQAQGQAQYVGAQPLQEKAFQTVEQNLAAQQPTFEQGKQFLGQAAGQDITGAVAPYLQAGTTASPLCAAKPLICQSANLNLGCLAGQYMSPYLKNAVQNLSDIGQRNIRQNLSPMATAAAVGSGQFNSQRGAQVLGQVEAQANQDLNNQISQLINQGYGQALQAAQTKQGALSNLAQTTSTAQQAQNEANLKAAATAGCAAGREASAAQLAGTGLGTLAQQASGVNMACINALSTLGGQQQTIKQNEQLFPLTSLSSLASLLSGYNIPTSTKTTLCMSPLSGLAAVGVGLQCLLKPNYKDGKAIPCSSVLSGILNTIKGLGKNPNTPTPGLPSVDTGSAADVINNAIGPDQTNYDQEQQDVADWWKNQSAGTPECPCYYFNANGGSIRSRAMGGSIGCGSTMGMGAAPAGLSYAACLTCEPINQRGVMGGGTVFGCSSTMNRGALPSMG
jgi:hypothetical protein